MRLSFFVDIEAGKRMLKKLFEESRLADHLSSEKVWVNKNIPWRTLCAIIGHDVTSALYLTALYFHIFISCPSNGIRSKITDTYPINTQSHLNQTLHVVTLSTGPSFLLNLFFSNSTLGFLVMQCSMRGYVSHHIVSVQQTLTRREHVIVLARKACTKDRGNVCHKPLIIGHQSSTEISHLFTPGSLQCIVFSFYRQFIEINRRLVKVYGLGELHGLPGFNWWAQGRESSLSALDSSIPYWPITLTCTIKLLSYLPKWRRF